MVALYFIGFLSSLGFSIVVPFLVFLVTKNGGNAFVLGAIGAAFWAAQFVGSSWLGPLSDRIGRKRVLFRSQLGAVGAWTVFLIAVLATPTRLAHVDTRMTGAFVVTIPLVLIALSRITDGMFNGSVSVANAYMADVTTGTARKVGFARLGVANNLGLVLGPMLSGVLAKTDSGIVLVVCIALGLSLCAAILTQLALPAIAVKPDAGPVVGSPFRTVFAIAELRPMIALYFFVYLGFSIFTSVLPIHAAQDLAWKSDALGGLFTVIAISLVVTEWLVLPRLAKITTEATLGAIGSAIVLAGYIAMARDASWALYVGAVCYGVGNGLSWPSYLALLARTGPPHLQGTTQGVAASTGSVASIIGTLSGGVMFEAIGASTFYVSATALALATAVFLRARLRDAGADL